MYCDQLVTKWLIGHTCQKSVNLVSGGGIKWNHTEKSTKRILNTKRIHSEINFIIFLSWFYLDKFGWNGKIMTERWVLIGL